MSFGAPWRHLGSNSYLRGYLSIGHPQRGTGRLRWRVALGRCNARPHWKVHWKVALESQTQTQTQTNKHKQVAALERPCLCLCLCLYTGRSSIKVIIISPPPIGGDRYNILSPFPVIRTYVDKSSRLSTLIYFSISQIHQKRI